MNFEDLEIIEPILKALKGEGYTFPTPIQEKSIPIFRVFWVLAVFLSSYALSFETGEDNLVVATFWLIADSLTGLMAAPNLIAIILLSPVIFKLAKEYFQNDRLSVSSHKNKSNK